MRACSITLVTIRSLFRRLLVALTALALMGSGMVVAAPMPAGGAAGTMMIVPCGAGMAGPAQAAPMRGMPCPGKVSACGKQLCCTATPGLTAQAGVIGSPDFDVAIRYWPAIPALGGRFLPPDPFPPIAA